MIDPDPFTQAYEAIWTALAARADWAELFTVGRRADKIDVTDRLKEIIKAGNLNGIVALDQSQYVMQPFGANSLIVSATQTYVLSVATATPALAKVNAIKWQTFLALRAAGPSLGLPSIITAWVIQQAQDRPQPPPSSQAAPGYASVAWIICQMNIDARLI